MLRFLRRLRHKMGNVVKSAVSPMASAAPGEENVLWGTYINDYFDSFPTLDAVRPTFLDVDPQTRQLPVTALLVPDINDVSFTDPDVIATWFETYSAAEPQIAFDAFCKGVACASLLLAPSHRDILTSLLELAAQHASTSSVLPALDSASERDVAIVVDQIFNNGEASSWLNLWAFSRGAFWLLSFMKDADVTIVTTRSGKQVTPSAYVLAFLCHFASLAYLPG